MTLNSTTRPLLPACCDKPPVYIQLDTWPVKHQVYCPACHRRVTGLNPDAVFQLWASAPLASK